jgi:MFS family permease
MLALKSPKAARVSIVPPRRPAAAWLYPAVLFYSIVLFGIITPRGILAIDLVRLRVCGNMKSSDNLDCNEDEVSRQAAQLSSWIGIVNALPQIFVSGVMGSIADRFGRRYPAIIACSGELLASILIACIAHYTLEPEWLIACAFVEGVTGSYTTFLASTSAYIADLNFLEAATISDALKVERCQLNNRS